MGICGGSSSPGISVVSNKYTINVENDEKKQIKNESNTKTINQNNNNNNKLIQANSTSSNNKNEEIIKNQESIKEEKKDKKKNKLISFNAQSSQNLDSIKYKSNKQINDLRDIERKKEKKKTNKLNDIKKVMFEKTERSSTPNLEKIDKEKNEKYKRRSKKSTTLVEKSRMESKFKEEMKLNVKTQTLIEEQKGDPSKKYKIVKRLGDGSYGTVFSVVNIQTGATVAMKKIEKVKENEIDDLEIKNEIDILKKLDHPNIVKIYEFYNTLTDFYIVTEYCKKGELYSYIKRSYSENQLAVLFYQVFSGLYYLHDHHILHRDLKLENIMISDIEKDLKTKEEYFWIKIIDFGTAKIFKKNKNEKAVVGSSYYIAPEVLKQKYNEKCDTWSVGVILYMLIVGRAPFDGKSDEDIIESIKIGVYNNKHPKLLAKSKEIQDLVNSLLERNINKRLSASEALNHSFFNKFNGRSLYSNFTKDEIQSYLDNLLNYKFQSKFQQLVLAFVVHNIPQSKETKIILKLFRYFNLSGNCKLTKVELINGLYQFRDKDKVDKVIDDIFLMLDGDNNGYIEYEEFLRACVDKKTILSDENLIYAFKFLDKEKSGFVSIKSIMRAFKKSNKTVEEIFKNSIKEVDRDNDGKINFEEFKELMLRVK